MKIKALMIKNIRGTRIVTMTNDTYKKMCEDKLKKEIEDIKKVYISSINEAGKFYVR
ncbi:MAG: hypothetical protein IE880_07105 [Epsilonproteobacteria bacterium]|nr:hypothetical protein [Campylobacterota bacterium]